MSDPPLFKDRQEAGEKLAQVIAAQAPRPPLIVYALPRGGLPVAEPIARRLRCPLDVIVAKKITEPQNPELAIGAVTADGHVLRARHRPAWMIGMDLWQAALAQAHQKAQFQKAQLIPSHPELKATGAIALLVDDGVATGMTMAVAVQALRQQTPREVWICAPVAPANVMEALHQWAEQVIVLANPEPFWSVGRFYQDFPQVPLEEARALLLGSTI
jgi:predicted phosphoribosyltransferase